MSLINLENKTSETSKREVDNETKASLKDHPDILKRVENYQKEGSKGRSLREVMKDLDIKP